MRYLFIHLFITFILILGIEWGNKLYASDSVSALSMFVGILPIIIGISYLISSYLKLFLPSHKLKKISLQDQEKQKIWFYNLQLPCLIWSILWILFLLCLRYRPEYYKITCWVGCPFSVISAAWKKLYGISTVSNILIGIFILSYHLVYFISTRFKHKNYHVTRKSFGISLTYGIVAFLITLLDGISHL